MRPAILGSLAALSWASSAQAEGDPGHAVYEQHCAACHQADGRGVPGAFPALAANPRVTGDVKVPLTIVRDGVRAMPAFGGDLDEAQIRAVVGYVRKAWGNKADAPAAPAAAER